MILKGDPFIPSFIKSLYPINVEYPSEEGEDIWKVKVSIVLLIKVIEGAEGGSAALS